MIYDVKHIICDIWCIMCGLWYMICNVWYTIYDNWIGGCGSAHSHGHLHLFSTIYNISYHHPIATHHRWQWPQFFLTSSSYFLQSNSTPSDRFSTLKVSWHANFPQYWAIVQISKEFLLVSCTLKSDLSKARAPCSHLFSSSQLLPWVSRQEVSKRNQPTCLSNTQLRRQTLIFRKYQLKAGHGQDLPSFWAETFSLSVHSVVHNYTLTVTLQFDKSRTDYSTSKVTQSLEVVLPYCNHRRTRNRSCTGTGPQPTQAGMCMCSPLWRHGHRTPCSALIFFRHFLNAKSPLILSCFVSFIHNFQLLYVLSFSPLLYSHQPLFSSLRRTWPNSG